MNMSEEDKLLYCKDIDRTIDQFNEIVRKNIRKVNVNKKLIIIGEYSNMLLGYGKDIQYLQMGKLNTSIETITRTALECYAILKNMFKFYKNDSKFEEYKKYLILLDMDQDLSAYKNLGRDKTVKDVQLEEVRNSIILRLKNIKDRYFSTELGDIESCDNIYVFSKKFYPLFELYKNKFKKYIGLSIGEALKDNKELTRENNGNAYSMSYMIYSDLCTFTHNNFTAIEEKVTDNGKIIFNSKGKNTDACVELVCYCLKDIVKNFEIACLS